MMETAAPTPWLQPSFRLLRVFLKEGLGETQGGRFGGGMETRARKFVEAQRKKEAFHAVFESRTF